MKVKVVKSHPDAVIPEYKTEGAAGFDFHIIEDVTLSNSSKVVPTGLKMEIPKGFELQIRPRSGLSLKTTLMIPNSPGTIDSDYRGEIGIIACSRGGKLINLNKGDRIAQGVIVPIEQVEFEQCEELSDTERGEGAYGSTN